MSFEKIPYDSQRLESIRIRLENFARTGEPIPYAVSVDGMEVIPKTIDATIFSSIYDLLTEKTRSLSIAEYIGNTRNRKTVCFYFTPTPGNGQTLQGIDVTQPVESIEEKVQRQVEQINQKQTNDRLQRENQTIKQQLNALLEKCDRLETDNDSLTAENVELKKLQNQNAEQNVFLELGREAIREWVKSKKPDEPLSGTPGQEKQTEQGKQNGEAPTHIAIPESEFENYKFFNDTFQKFEPIPRGLVTRLIELLGKHPELVEETYMNAFNTIQNGNEEN